MQGFCSNVQPSLFFLDITYVQLLVVGLACILSGACSNVRRYSQKTSVARCHSRLVDYEVTLWGETESFCWRMSQCLSSRVLELDRSEAFSILSSYQVCGNGGITWPGQIISTLEGLTVRALPNESTCHSSASHNKHFNYFLWSSCLCFPSKWRRKPRESTGCEAISPDHKQVISWASIQSYRAHSGRCNFFFSRALLTIGRWLDKVIMVYDPPGIFYRFWAYHASCTLKPSPTRACFLWLNGLFLLPRVQDAFIIS